ncbi:MAG TPA: iron-containing alcohol dehydrogenase, partial [Bacillota bacterium]
MKWLWRMPREIVFGAGRVEVVGRRLQEAGVRQALVVTDAGVRAAGLLPAVTGSLASAHIEHMIFAEAVPNPT